jgi:hypothetical protein
VETLSTAAASAFRILDILPNDGGAFVTPWVEGFSDATNGATGTLTLTAVSESAAVGAFEFTSPTVDGGTLRFEGTFNAPFCADIP